MPKIYRRLQDSRVAIEGTDGSPFSQDQLAFADLVATDNIMVLRNGEEVDTFRWQDIQQQDGSPAGADKPAVLAYCDAQLLPVQVSARFSNSDATTNLNTGNTDFIDQLVPVCGIESKQSDLFTRVNDNVFQCDFFGEICIAVNLHLTSAGVRNAMQIRMVRDPLGTPNVEGPIASTGYIRNTTGHQESSLHLIHVTGVGQGNQFAVGIRRESTNATACTLRFANTSAIAVWRLR